MRVGVLQSIRIFQPNKRFKLKTIRGVYKDNTIQIEKAYADDVLVSKYIDVRRDNKIIYQNTKFYRK